MCGMADVCAGVVDKNVEPACDFSRSRAAMTTVAPAEASPRAMPSPMPPFPPVTTATFPLKSNNFNRPCSIEMIEDCMYRS